MIILQYFILFLILIAGILYGKSYYRRIVNPISLFSVMFALSLLLAFGYSEQYKRQFEDCLFYLIVGIALFLLSFVVSQYIHNNRQWSTENVNVEINSKVLNIICNICVVVVIVSFALAFYEVLRVSRSITEIFGGGTALRHRYLNRSSPRWLTLSTIICSINVFAFTSLFPLGIEYKAKHIYTKLIAIFAIRLLHSILTMSKEAFILYLIFFLSSYIQIVGSISLEKRLIKKYWKWALVLVVILLVVIINQRDYLRVRYESYNDAIFGSFRTYIGGPIRNFALLIDSNIEHTNGRLSFRAIFNILARFGIGSGVSKFQNFVDGGGNVYTIFGNMYSDYGIAGIIFLSLVFGYLLGMLYRRKVGRISHIITNSIINVTMFFGYYDLKLIQTIYLVTIFYGVFFDYVLRRIGWVTYRSTNENHISEHLGGNSL